MSSFSTKGLEKSKKMPGTSSIKPYHTNRLYLPIGKGTKIVLLDDESVNIYEHGIWIQGDKTAMKLKVTCTSPGPDPVPHKCRICNAMIKDERINRRFVAYLSCIDLAKFEIEGKKFTHTRKLVPLNNPAAKKLLRRKESKGKLTGGVFAIHRNEKTSPQVGDDWDWLKRINLAKFFQKSPRIKAIMEYHSKKGQKISPKEALQILIAPFDYEKVLAPTRQRIDYFLGYIGFGDAPKTEAPGEDEENAYDYGDDSEDSSKDAEEEDFTSFEDEDEETPPSKPKKKKAKKKKAKKKKKKIYH